MFVFKHDMFVIDSHTSVFAGEKLNFAQLLNIQTSFLDAFELHFATLCLVYCLYLSAINPHRNTHLKLNLIKLPDIVFFNKHYISNNR